MSELDPSQFPTRTRGRSYEDFSVGQVFEHHRGRTITEPDTVLFTTPTLAYNPIYVNAEVARAEGHPTIVVNPMCSRARALGFGKWAIHPSQVPIANERFSPTQEEVEGARRVIDAYREAESSGAGAAGMGGALIDAAAVRIMEPVIAKAELIERKAAAGG